MEKGWGLEKLPGAARVYLETYVSNNPRSLSRRVIGFVPTRVRRMGQKGLF